ncbi:hypothetical protein PsorP6_004220 [Peronosclerospora sorghi]|uniref:Uncharacterized protein n=1 Tax=Peronosclerospora sorghi TaxID=230839 RepID=A0ACC0VLD0_9STRA|nr:hypothetical protein PsorP6_004220 [Peronosclerospora sorghi]
MRYTHCQLGCTKAIRGLETRFHRIKGHEIEERSRHDRVGDGKLLNELIGLSSLLLPLGRLCPTLP